MIATFSRLLLTTLMLAAALSTTSQAFAAADADELCVQAFLDFKGFDPGPLDGAAGKKTFAAAAEFKAKQTLTIADLGPDNAAEWCTFAKTDTDYASLLGYSYNTGPLWNQGRTGNADYDQVLLGDSVGQYELALRSIKNPTALSFVPLEGGLVAARIKVVYADKGHREDWFYNDEPGRQQRFELREKQKFWMKANQTYWVRMSIFVPRRTIVMPLDQLVLSDLKPETHGNIILDPLAGFTLNAGAFQLNHHFGRKLDCVTGYNEQGGDNTLCDLSKEQDDILSMPSIFGKWLNVVYRVHWADDDSGRFHIWVNDAFVAGYAGNNLHGGTSVQSKFGVYRGYYGSQPRPQGDARIYFAGVGRSDSCEGLGLGNCAALEADIETIAKPGVTRVNIVESTDLADYLAAGGKVKCDIRKC